MTDRTLNLILVRHGQTIKNASRIVQGQGDGDLSPNGIQQTKELAARLKDERIDIAYSSDLKRAVTTACLLLEGRSISPIQDSRLREQKYGIFEGKKLELMLKEMKKDASVFTSFNPQEGERSDSFQQRIRQFFDDIVSKHLGESVLVVTHYGVIRTAIDHILCIQKKKELGNKLYPNWKSIFFTIDSNGNVINGTR